MRKEISAAGQETVTVKTLDNTKILKAEQQMEQALLETERKRREELEKLAQAQAKNVNKTMDTKYLTNLKAAKEIEDALLQTEIRRRKEQEALALSQAKVTNKALETNYKQQIANQKEQITLQQKVNLFQKQSAIEVTKLKHQYKDLYDTNALRQYINKVQQLDAVIKQKGATIKSITYQTELLNKEFRQIQADSMARGLNTANKSAISFLESMKLVMYKFSKIKYIAA